MPDRGLLEANSIAEAAFAKTGGVTIPGARWLQLTFEVDRQAALANMPGDVGRPVPPYGRLLVATTPVGNLAVLSVGGRYRMMPRNVTVSALGQGLALGGIFGNGTDTGAIELHRDGQQVSASIAGPNGALATVTLPDLYAIEPSMLRWDAFVVMARADGNVVIGEVTPTHEVETAFLTKGATLDMEPSLARTHPWRRLRSLGVISACYAEGSLVFSEPTVQQTLV